MLTSEMPSEDSQRKISWKWKLIFAEVFIETSANNLIFNNDKFSVVTLKPFV